jgi:site-specific recombinase XerD
VGHTLFQFTAHGVQRVIERLSDRTRVAVFPHKVRHAAASLMRRRGVDIYAVKTILGHQSFQTTEAYLALCPEDIRAKHQVGSPFLTLQGMLAVEPPVPAPPKKRWFWDVA